MLEVHVIGGKEGESTIVRLPNGEWGVIDVYCSDLNDADSNPTVNFLRSRGVTNLDFFCLTHPHQDHTRGARHIFQSFKIRQFWTFGACTPAQLYRNVLKVLTGEALRSQTDKIWMTDVANDLEWSLRRASDLSNQANDRLQITRMNLGGLLLRTSIDDEQLSIFGLGPSGRNAEHYENSLANCFEPQTGKLRSQPPKVHHNTISSGVLIEYGKARVVLGGDIERDGWADVLSHGSRLNINANLIKVSHHGSTTGYCENLWSGHLSPSREAIAVITPFTKRSLPRPDGLEHIASNARTVYSTFGSATASAEATVFASLFSNGINLPIDAQIALSETFSDFEEVSSKRGRCSFSVHANGEVKLMELVGAATQLFSDRQQDV